MSIPNKNILQLRQLAEKLCTEGINSEYKAKLLVIKQLMEEHETLISECKSHEDKLKCYEEIHKQISKILKNIKTDN